MDGSNKKKGGSGFQVGKKKLKTKLTPLAKAKAAQAMELDKWGAMQVSLGKRSECIKCQLAGSILAVLSIEISPVVT